MPTFEFVNCTVFDVTFPFVVIVSRLDAMFDKSPPSPSYMFAFMVPTTSNAYEGVVVPIPTRPVVVSTKRFAVPASMFER